MTVRLLVRLAVTVAVAVLLAGEPVQAAAQSGAPPWAACGNSAPDDKPAKTFPTRPAIGGPARTYAVLLCGNQAYGYRHIANRHGQDWSNLAFYTGGGWRDVADFAISQTLVAPQPGYPRFNPKNETWTYKTPLEIRDTRGEVRATYWPMVSVAARDGRIITSFPTRDPR